MYDPYVLQSHCSARVKKESRHIASCSIQTCMTQVAAIINTLFIPGKWHDKPDDKELSDGAKFAHSIAEKIHGIEMKPIASRYISNFDDTGRHFARGEQTKKSNLDVMKIATKSLSHSLCGTSRMHHSTKIGDSVVGDVKSKFKVQVTASSHLAPIVVEFPIFSSQELPNKPFVTMKVP